MTAKLHIAIALSLLALCGLPARAQDSARVPDAGSGAQADAKSEVDASVHVSTDEKSAAPPASRQGKRQPTTTTRWAFQPANQPAATRFQPPPDSGPISAPSDPSNNADSPSTLFNPLTRSNTPPAEILPRGSGTPFRIEPANPAATPADDRHAAAVRAMLANLNSDNNVSPAQDGKSRNSLFSPFARVNRFSPPVREKKSSPSENSFSESPLLKSRSSSSTLLKPGLQKTKSQKSKLPGSPNPATSLGSSNHN